MGPYGYNARLFLRVHTNSQAIRTDPYGDSDRLFVRVRLHNGVSLFDEQT